MLVKLSRQFNEWICGDREHKKTELTNNKAIKGKYHVTIKLKFIFGCVE